MARNNNNNKLKAFVRFDGSGRVVSSSLIVQAFKPKVGNWKEIDAKECCNYTTTTTTTTVAPVYSFELSYGTGKGEACGNPFLTTYYAASTPLTNGVILYTDINLSIVAPDGWYANADTNVAYEITNGDGVITTTTFCEE